MKFLKCAALCVVAVIALAAVPSRAAGAPLETYLKITDVAWMSASPNGARIAYTGQAGGNWQVWITNRDGSHRKELTFGKDAADFARWIPRDPHTILYAKSTGGSGVDQLYYVRDDRSGSVPLFPNESSVTHVFGAFSPDGTQIAFSSNKRNASFFDVYILNRSDGRARRVFTVNGTAYATAWSPGAGKLLVRQILTPYNDNLYIVDLRSGTSRLITPHAGDANFDSSQFTPDMRGVVCVSDLDRQFHTIQRIDIATLAMRPLLDVPNDIDQVLLSADGKQMAYIVNRDGFGDVVLADAASGRTIAAPSMPPYIAEDLHFIDGGNVLLYAASGPTFPKVIWTYDLRLRKTTRVIAPDFHGVPPSSIVEPAVVRVRSFDGTAITAWYFRPKAHTGNLTAFLDIHGGPEEQDRAWFYPWAQYLVSRGYALLDPNIRGSTGYGRTFLHMADAHNRENAVKDVNALREWVIAAGGANPKSIFVNGASYGGYIVLASLYHYPAAYAGGIDVYGVADWVDFLRRTAPARRANREGVYGSLTRDRTYLASISPINHVSNIKSPVLIIAGANDTTVPVEQSKRIAQALKQNGVPVKLHIFPNEGHGISNLADLISVYRWTLSFMQRYGR